MPKEFTDYLHDATKATFEGNVKAIAFGWNRTERNVYQILSEDRPDNFPAFLDQYIGVLKSGVSTCNYDNEFEYARQRYGKKIEAKSETECFKNHSETHSKTMVRFIDALKDGKLTLDEIKSLEECLNDEETNLQMIRTMLNFRRSVLEK